MKPVTLLLREQMKLLKPILTNKNVLAAARIAQDKAGELGAHSNEDTVSFEDVKIGDLTASWARPINAPKSDKIIMYIHGGGYTAGGLEYSKGFGSMLANSTGRRTLCVAYRLAPESKFPCAVEDVLCAYQYLLLNKFQPKNIVFAGESAGGGLEYCLIHKLKSLKLPLPAAVVAISPWVDISNSGESHVFNAKADPSISKELLDYYADCYIGDKNKRDPLASPIFGNLSGFPDSFIVASRDEVLLSDSRAMAKKLHESGVRVTLVEYPAMWHAFVLYNVPESQKALAQITDFIGEY